MVVRTRIAPSPTGYPHIGTMFQALFDYAFAKQNGGSFLVRIEDTDRTRFVNDAEEKLYEAFDWLSIKPDESPKVGGEYGPYRQSERLALYKTEVLKLIESDQAYYCFCDAQRLENVRKEKQAAGLPPMYDRHCRNLPKSEANKRALTEKYVIRLKVPDNQVIEVNDLVRGKITFDSQVIDDQVLLKSDGFPTYHLAVVVDDHAMNISHVIRGEEWLSSAPKHKLLYQAFGYKEPLFFHTPLLRNPDKSKLSKRHGHAAVSWYQEQGYLPEAVINFLATRVWNHPSGKEVFGIEELIQFFKWDEMHIQGPVVDLDKLKWLNGQWIRSLKDEELVKRLKGFVNSEISETELQKVLPLVKERLETLNQIDKLTHYFFTTPNVDLNVLRKTAKMTDADLATYIEQVIETLRDSKWEKEELENNLRRLQSEKGLKPRPAFMSLRLAITGEEATPPLFDVMTYLSKEEVTARLNHVRMALIS